MLDQRSLEDLRLKIVEISLAKDFSFSTRNVRSEARSVQKYSSTAATNRDAVMDEKDEPDVLFNIR